MKGRIVRKEPTSNKLPLLGKIKCGMKGDAKFPKSLDYFIADGKYKGVFDEAFGKEPKTIPVVFVSDDPMDSCNERYECRDSQGRLAGYGNGEEMFMFNPSTDEYELEEDRNVFAKAGKWETILTIKFIIPEIRSVFGIWQLSTKGEKSSIPAIRDTFDAVLNTAGTVRNIPFDLQVKKVKSQKPNSKSLFPVISLVPNLSQSNLLNLAKYIKSGNDIKELGKITNDVMERIGNESFEQPKEIGQ